MVRNTSPESTVLPARSDSDAMFCLQNDQGLRIDRSLCVLTLKAPRKNASEK